MAKHTGPWVFLIVLVIAGVLLAPTVFQGIGDLVNSASDWVKNGFGGLTGESGSTLALQVQFTDGTKQTFDALDKKSLVPMFMPAYGGPTASGKEVESISGFMRVEVYTNIKPKVAVIVANIQVLTDDNKEITKQDSLNYRTLESLQTTKGDYRTLFETDMVTITSQQILNAFSGKTGQHSLSFGGKVTATATFEDGTKTEKQADSLKGTFIFNMPTDSTITVGTISSIDAIVTVSYSVLKPT